MSGEQNSADNLVDDSASESSHSDRENSASEEDESVQTFRELFKMIDYDTLDKGRV